MDFADIDGDGALDALAVLERSVVAANLENGADGAEWRTLFESDSEFRFDFPAPRRVSIVRSVDGRTVERTLGRSDGR